MYDDEIFAIPEAPSHGKKVRENDNEDKKHHRHGHHQHRHQHGRKKWEDDH